MTENNADGNGADGRVWTRRDETNLRELAEECLPAPLIGLKLGCSEDEVYAKASQLGVGIAPVFHPSRAQ